MDAAHELLKAITIVLGVAAFITVLFHWLKLPVVLGYILAGLMVGPHFPFPLVANPQVVSTLSELGVILLMFGIGLELSMRKLLQLAGTAGVTALLECSLMLWLGYLVGRGLGWSALESIFTGGLVAISSTSIVAKAFDEQKVRGLLRDRVMGILVVEDLVAILLVSGFTALAHGSGLSAGALAGTVGRLLLFLVVTVIAGIVLVPRLVRAVVRLRSGEITAITSVALSFGGALLAHAFGYSVALGAFVAGSLVAESGHGVEIDHLIRPVRDVFAAIFFVSVGMLIQPALIAEHWSAVVLLTLTVVVGKGVGVSLGSFLTGNNVRTSVQSGMSLAQIGEFSFIIAGLGVSLGATRNFLYPVAVAVSAITAFTTPWLIRASGPLANWIDRTLPRPLQTFASLYGSWFEDLGAARHKSLRASPVRRMIRALAIDASFVAAIAIGAAWAARWRVAVVAARLELPPDSVRLGILLLAAVAVLPFLFGMVRVSRRLGFTLATGAFPEPGQRRADLAAAPRRALIVTLQLAILLAVGLPIAAITQPFVPGPALPAVLLLSIVALSVGFWRSATNLEGHVRAGAQAVIEVLSAQATSGSDDAQALHEVAEALPGIGDPVSYRVPEGAPAAGKTLGELNLRGVTGATVLAIRREGEQLVVPTAAERLRGGDLLVLAGSDQAVAAARSYLEAPTPA